MLFRPDDHRFLMEISGQISDVLETFLPYYNHAILFSNGYYPQTGEFKLFETGIEDLKFEKRIVTC